MTNKYKILIYLMIAVAFILGMIVGQQGATEGENNEENKIITDKIAIVNMDEGIFIENECLNYGAALLNDLDNNFLVTGLEDARQGMKLGIYAAYIIIPTTFSDDVVSLNSRPQQSQISYTVHTQLREDIREKVIYDIFQFNTSLSRKVSYMYLCAVLNEFHIAQDYATQLMINDEQELKAFEEVQPIDIISAIKVTPITEIDGYVNTLDLSEYYANYQNLLNQIDQKYIEYLATSQKDQKEMLDAAKSLMEEIERTEELLYNIDFSKDVSGNDILNNGVEAVDKYFTDYNEKIELKRNAWNSQIEFVDDYLREHHVWKHSVRKEVSEKIEQYSEKYKIVSVSDGDAGVRELSWQQVENDLLQYLADEPSVEKDTEEFNDDTLLMNSRDPIGAFYNNPISEQKEWEKLDAEKVREILNDSVYIPLQDNIEAIREPIIEQYKSENENLIAVQKRITGFNALKYIDYDELQILKNKIAENGENLTLAITDNDVQQMEYVDTVYETTRTDLHNLATNIEDTKFASDEAVTIGLKNLQELKTENSIQNQGMFENFANQLPYSRLGTIENKSTYEFMVNPISYYEINAEEVENQGMKGEQGKRAGWIVGICCIAFVLWVSKYYFHKYNERKEETQWMTN